jgi:hypothetical protein
VERAVAGVEEERLLRVRQQARDAAHIRYCIRHVCACMLTYADV